MNRRTRQALMAIFAMVLLSQCSSTGGGSAYSGRSRIASEARAALMHLYDLQPETRRLGARAEAVLVFPDIFKAGFMVGGMGGTGALISRDVIVNGFYRTKGLSYGLQAGMQHYSYALFFMDEEALNHLTRSHGWEIGLSPNLVIVDEGAATSLSTLTLHKGIYAMFFNQHGLMGGLGLQGSKITQMDP